MDGHSPSESPGAHRNGHCQYNRDERTFLRIVDMSFNTGLA